LTALIIVVHMTSLLAETLVAMCYRHEWWQPAGWVWIGGIVSERGQFVYCTDCLISGSVHWQTHMQT